MPLPRNTLPVEVVREYLNYDPDTGQFSRKKRTGPRGYVGPIDVKPSPIYLQIGFKGKTFKLHRLAFVLMEGRWPDEVDHINLDKTDNRWINLREASHGENKCNTSKYRSNTSGCKCVTFNKFHGKWWVRISIDGIRKSFGYYSEFEEAEAVYLSNVGKLHGGFARVA